MANMTIAVDDQLLRAARVKAVQQGTSVNEICRQAIERFAQGTGDVEARLARLNVLAKKTRQPEGSPSADVLWPRRDALYGTLTRKNSLSAVDALEVVNPFVLAVHEAPPAPKNAARRKR